ncbi:MAG: rRNA maturation RNase YbeY [Burkholderiaceae bacterium]|jgi:probable rRNA maturation factor|nr:rRNA maturation RNase YbeY [Burkholderiales bacterium]MCZ8337697.1 rRNA maturation RNase YbeY [Burkholderiaceae bacterium]
MPTSATRPATRAEPARASRAVPGPSGRRASQPPPAPRLALSIQIEPGAGDCPADRAQLRRWAQAALSRDAALALRFVGASEGRALNRDYRGKDHATNVLTFAYDDGPAGAGPVQADIVVCLPVVRREARAQCKTARDHLAHLVVHGVLHAQGMDHEDAGEAREMEAREVEVLRRFRIADPYR